LGYLNDAKETEVCNFGIQKCGEFLDWNHAMNIFKMMNRK
jgi:hypothetical protein